MLYHVIMHGWQFMAQNISAENEIKSLTPLDSRR